MPRILIYTPCHGVPETAQVSLGYHQAAVSLARSLSIELMDGNIFTDCDLVRARSRAVRVALESPNMTHVLHWDADVVGHHEDVKLAIDGMLATGHDLVGAPYPRKRVRWDRLAAGIAQGVVPFTREGLQSAAYDYPYRFGDMDGGSAEIQVVNGCVEVEQMAFGFTLTSRAMLERMWNAYAPTLSYGDPTDGHLAWTVGLFQLMMPAQSATAPFAVDPMLSEDYSFCERWRRLGGKVQMYIGPGSPMSHVGPNLFRGVREGVVHPL